MIQNKDKAMRQWVMDKNELFTFGGHPFMLVLKGLRTPSLETILPPLLIVEGGFGGVNFFERVGMNPLETPHKRVDYIFCFRHNIAK